MSRRATANEIPKLRFPNFEGAWTEKKVIDIAPLQRGYDLPNEQIVSGLVPIVYSNGILKYHNVSQAKGPGVVTGRSGTIGKVHFIEQDYWPHNTALWVTDFKSNHSKFVYYFYVKLDLAQFGAGSGVPTLNRNDVHAATAHIPQLPEQQKIADFLGAVDARVGLLRRRREALRAYKKGMMQRLFTQDLRFTKADGSPFPNWQEKRLGEVAVSHNSGIYKKSEIYGEGANIIGVSDLFSISVVKGQEFRRVPLTEKEISENALNEGDILYAESSLVRKGIAKSVYVSKLGAGTAFAWHTRRYAVDAKQALAAYIYFYLESDRARRFIESVATQTALTGITTRDYFACPVSLPHTEEQQKIADTLTALDAKIDAVTAQMDAMLRFKKGLLQQMFV